MNNSNYAGFWKRFLAYWVDTLIIGLITIPLNSLSALGQVAASSPATHVTVNPIGGLIGLAVTVAYFVFFWVHEKGQTLGHRLLALRVVREDGKPIDIGTAVIRYIGYIISSAILMLGFLWVAWDPKKQGWHDKIAKTFVVKTEGKSHTIIASVIVIGSMLFCFLIIVGLFAAGVFLYKGIKNNPQALNNTVSQIPSQTLSESEINTLADETFNTVNGNRVKKGLPALTLNQKLCAYAQKRLEELDNFGKLDDYKGFIEDMRNPDIIAAYFNVKGTANNLMYVYKLPITGSKIADFWTNDVTNSAVNDGIYTQGCVRANTRFVTLVVSSL